MNVAALEVLFDVVLHGSLSAVARDRQLTTSTISRMIASLEAELGTRLLQRTTRKVTPTEAGLRLLEQTKPHLEGLRRARESLTDASGPPRGELRITASTSFGIHRLAPLLGEFSQVYPELQLEMHLTDAVVDIVAQRYDVAIRHGALEDSTLIAQRLLKSRYIVCASRAYLRKFRPPREPRELSSHRCLVFPLAGVSRAWRFKKKSGGTETIELPNALVVNSGLALRQCALDGAGIALLSDWLIGEDVKSGKLVDLFPGTVASPSHFQPVISAVYPSREQVPRKVKALIEFLKRKL